METEKPWWQSKTIWTGLATSVMAILTAAGITPDWLNANFIDSAVTFALGVATVVFRHQAESKIKKNLPE